MQKVLTRKLGSDTFKLTRKLGGKRGDFMNKEEILKKAQSRKPNQMDEMEMDIFQKSSYIGMTVGLIMCIILMIINIYCNQPYQDVYSVFCSILCGQYMYRWTRQKDKFTLFCGICWGFTAVLLFILYLTKIFV